MEEKAILEKLIELNERFETIIDEVNEQFDLLITTLEKEEKDSYTYNK